MCLPCATCAHMRVYLKCSFVHLQEDAASQERFRQAAEHQDDIAKLKEGEARLLQNLASLRESSSTRPANLLEGGRCM